MTTILTFRCQGTRYAVDSELVLEVVELPFISPWPGAPQGVAGVIDYRGQLIPVLDVALRLGGQPGCRSETSQLVVVQAATGVVALLVDAASDLRPLAEFRPLPQDGASSLQRALPYLLGVATIDDQVVLGLDVEALGEFPADAAVGTAEPGLEDQQGLLAERARELALPQAQSGGEPQRSLVVVRLAGERLGIPVEEVAALTNCPAFTSVPGAPAHLLGLAYHRGGLLRLVDVRSMCGLETGGPTPGEVVVLTGPGMPTGLVVDAIESVSTVPDGGAGQRLAFGDGWLTVLELARLDIREPSPELAVDP